MITGILLLIWGIGIVILAFKIQSDIQEAKDDDSQRAKELYNESPILFCSMMGLTLLAWPLYLVSFIIKDVKAKKGN